MRELSIFIDESGDFGPFEKHSPFYILSLVFHDQSDDITGHLEKIHAGLRTRGLAADHAVHAGPLIPPGTGVPVDGTARRAAVAQ